MPGFVSQPPGQAMPQPQPPGQQPQPPGQQPQPPAQVQPPGQLQMPGQPPSQPPAHVQPPGQAPPQLPGQPPQPPGQVQLPAMAQLSAVALPPGQAPVGTQEVRRAERLRRIQFVAIGLLVQLLAVVPVVAVLITLTRREDPLGEITKYSFRLGWHDLLHQPKWIALLIACVALYMVGAVIVAWPFTRRWWTRALAVPIGALAGLALLGALALVCVAIVFLVALIFSDGDVPSFDFGGGGRKRAPAQGAGPPGSGQ